MRDGKSGGNAGLKRSSGSINPPLPTPTNTRVAGELPVAREAFSRVPGLGKTRGCRGTSWRDAYALEAHDSLEGMGAGMQFAKGPKPVYK